MLSLLPAGCRTCRPLMVKSLVSLTVRPGSMARSLPAGTTAHSTMFRIWLPQAPLVAPPQPDGPYQASVLIFVPEYAPEYITVQLHPDITVPEAIARMQAARDDICVQRFDRLLPARPQTGTAVRSFCGFLPTGMGDQSSYSTAHGYNGTMYSMLAPLATTKASLLSMAGIPPDQGVEVFAADYPFPLQEDDVFELQSGYCIHFVAQGQDHFAVGYFSDMLLSSSRLGGNF